MVLILEFTTLDIGTLKQTNGKFMIIYLDMDDVVADWMPAARAIVNRNWNYGERIPESDWAKVKAKERLF
jgi:hypothetical protein